VDERAPGSIAERIASAGDAGRAAVGLTCLVAPGLASRAMGLGALSPSTAYLIRLFGARELLIAAACGARWSGVGAAQRAAVAVDMVDTMSAIAGPRRLSLRVRSYVAAVSGASAIAGIARLARTSRLAQHPYLA
jgi:hypothetical protein